MYKICLTLIWLEHFFSHILVIRVGSACRSARYGLVVNPLTSENNLHLASLDSDFRVCLVVVMVWMRLPVIGDLLWLVSQDHSSIEGSFHGEAVCTGGLFRMYVAIWSVSALQHSSNVQFFLALRVSGWPRTHLICHLDLSLLLRCAMYPYQLIRICLLGLLSPLNNEQNTRRSDWFGHSTPPGCESTGF